MKNKEIETLLNEELNKLKSAVEYIESAKETAKKFELQIVELKAIYDEEVGKNTEQLLNLDRKIEATQEKLSTDFTNNFKALNNLFSGNHKSILTEIDKELRAVRIEMKEVTDSIQLSQKSTQKLSEIEAKLEAYITEKQRLSETVQYQLTNFDGKIKKIIENNYKKSTEFQKAIDVTQSSLKIFSNERKELKEELLEEQRLREKLQKRANFSLAVAIVALLTSLLILAVLALKWYL
jgi:hypothetical protein